MTTGFSHAVKMLQIRGGGFSNTETRIVVINLNNMASDINRGRFSVGINYLLMFGIFRLKPNGRRSLFLARTTSRWLLKGFID